MDVTNILNDKLYYSSENFNNKLLLVLFFIYIFLNLNKSLSKYEK